METTRYGVCILLLTLALGTPASTQDDPHDLSYCVNHAGNPDKPLQEPHICTARCERTCGAGENRGCSTYCRADRCFCVAECDRPQENNALQATP